MGDRLGWTVKTQAGHGHAIGLVVSLDGGVHFQHWSNITNRHCTGVHVPFECCSGADSGTCDHGNPMIIASTKNGSWTAGGGSCDVTRRFGCVGTPNVLYDEQESNSSRRWKMWFVGSTHDHTQVGFASSPDGVSWSEHPGPIFDMQAQPYIQQFCLNPGVCGGNGYLVVRRFEGTFYMWFAPMGNAMGLATASEPEGPWEAYAGNPILTLKHTSCPNPTSDWPLGYDVYQEGGEYRMIVGCMDRKNRVPCPGGATSHRKIVLLSRFLALSVSLTQRASLFQRVSLGRVSECAELSGWEQLQQDVPISAGDSWLVSAPQYRDTGCCEFYRGCVLAARVGDGADRTVRPQRGSFVRREV